MNVIFGVVMVSIVTDANTVTDDGSMTFLTGFAIFFASLVVFKFTFAFLYQVRLENS